MSIELVVAAVIAILWIGLVVSAIAFVSMRLRKRSLRRGTWPVRLIPWYLGGTPEMPLDAPPESARAKRRGTKGRR
ncbi:MAG TPA: hypothetical protein VIP07_13185 [Candidatus Limnocylindria bacterium]